MQFIGEAGGRVFAGLEGALLGSTDGARWVQFLIRQPLKATSYPTIRSMLALRNRSDIVLAAGVDKATGKPTWPYPPMEEGAGAT